MNPSLIGIIGGSGLYQMDALQNAQEHRISTPFGDPSDVLVTGSVHGVPVVFLARHGRGHRLLPQEVPYRANIYAMKQLGVRYLLSVSAVGAARPVHRPDKAPRKHVFRRGRGRPCVDGTASLRGDR